MQKKEPGLSPDGESKRAFLKVVGTLGVGITASYLSTYLPKIDFYENNPKNKTLEESLESIFISDAERKFHYGGSHYLVKGVHSDNSFLGEQIVRAVSEVSDIDVSEDKSLFELYDDNDWIIIGAPSSNKYSAEIFNLDSMTLNPIKNKADFRYSYEYGATDDLIDLKRYTASGELQQSTIKASIIDNDKGYRYFPDEGGWLEKDYLLVTRIPVKIKNGIRYRFVVGGVHGAGTRGFDKLIRNDSFTKSEKTKLKRAATSPCQILAQVHVKNAKGRSFIEDVRIIDVFVA